MRDTTHKIVERIIERALTGDKTSPRKQCNYNYDAVAQMVPDKVELAQGQVVNVSVAPSSAPVLRTWERRSSRTVIFHNQPWKNWISVDRQACQLCCFPRHRRGLFAPLGGRANVRARTFG
ncbi:hypothetical protein GCM10022419_010040 [Nonomuraea rosea]|uniref:Uncharacterized protein n=1 Tax=Nonomuraea rosea TaxID=638574 RepID=A0ABP6VCF3_9ACTN